MCVPSVENIFLSELISAVPSLSAGADSGNISGGRERGPTVEIASGAGVVRSSFLGPSIRDRVKGRWRARFGTRREECIRCRPFGPPPPSCDTHPDTCKRTQMGASFRGHRPRLAGKKPRNPRAVGETSSGGGPRSEDRCSIH